MINQVKVSLIWLEQNTCIDSRLVSVFAHSSTVCNGPFSGHYDNYYTHQALTLTPYGLSPSQLLPGGPNMVSKFIHLVCPVPTLPLLFIQPLDPPLAPLLSIPSVQHLFSSLKYHSTRLTQGLIKCIDVYE